MLDLRMIDTREFVELVNEDYDVIRQLMRDCSHLGYTDRPYYYIILNVEKANVKDCNKEIIAKFLYSGITNRPDHRFYDTKGYSITLR